MKQLELQGGEVSDNGEKNQTNTGVLVLQYQRAKHDSLCVSKPTQYSSYYNEDLVTAIV